MMRLARMSGYHHFRKEDEEDKLSFILLLLSLGIFLVIVLTNNLVTLDWTRRDAALGMDVGKIPQADSVRKATRSDCAKANSNFQACVEGQKKGSGCEWFATCDLCVPQGSNPTKEICP